MANYEQRLTTYFTNCKWCIKEGSCSPANMAKAGFICTTNTAVQCYYCDKELDGWVETDDPWEEHTTHASYCPFVKKYGSLPDPRKFSIRDALLLEKEKILLKVNNKFQESLDTINDCVTDGEHTRKTKRRKDNQRRGL